MPDRDAGILTDFNARVDAIVHELQLAICLAADRTTLQALTERAKWIEARGAALTDMAGVRADEIYDAWRRDND